VSSLSKIKQQISSVQGNIWLITPMEYGPSQEANNFSAGYEI
jgi:hypothetical protein